MAACRPPRFLANDRNAIREATLDPSSVLPIADAVLQLPTARLGTAQVRLTGDYSGDEPATYDIEIVDAADNGRVSAPVLSGEGSGTLTNITSTLPAQDFTVQLKQAGLVELSASVNFDGAIIKARDPGVDGNDIFIEVDQSGLTFTAQAYSLLHDLAAGAGGKDSPLEGAEYDFDTKAMGADGQIPATAHRISFGDDSSAVYLQYKAYADGKWKYYFVPEIAHDVPRGTVINFVTGGRDVRIGTGSPFELYEDVVTLYDLLEGIRENSQLVDVDGVVANDRSPDGQAAHELLTRTDAHVEPSYGEGSTVATGFVGTSCAADAGTQLVVANCRAVTAADHPLAGVGRERWELTSSLLGDLGDIVTGEPYSNASFALTIPARLPYGFGVQKGRFSVSGIAYAPRVDTDPDEPPICMKDLALGPNAVDETITLVYTKRPSGDCDCSQLPAPPIDPRCLGANIEGEDHAMSYQDDTVARLKTLWEWYTGVVRAQSSIETDTGYGIARQDPFVTGPVGVVGVVTIAGSTGEPIGESLLRIVQRFERTAALMDPLEGGSPGYRSSGFLAWDDALSELQGDVATIVAHDATTLTFPSDRYVARMAAVLITSGISPLGESDASTIESGDGCWRDIGGSYWWTVVGSEKGAYAPAFTNTLYYASRASDTDGKYYSTHEFALYIAMVDTCVADLREGDTITLVIGDAGWPATYQVGDQLFLPIIAAQPLYLAGGRDASLVETWNVSGSVAGPLPNFEYDPDAPADYQDASPPTLSFTLSPGGIPFAEGDTFRFSTEGGHYRSRKDGGAWSGSTVIPSGSVAFDSGLFLEFVTGAAPSFVAGDLYSFSALQPWAVSNLRTPTVERWQWSGTAASLVVDLGSAQSLDMIGIARHTLPEGTTITIEGGTTIGVYTWSESIDWRLATIAHPLSETRTARYLRLTLGSAAEGGIGWLWAGLALSTSLSADTLPRRDYRIDRGQGGLDGGARYLGRSISADVEWTEGAMSEADMSGIAAMLDWIKTNDDEPLIFLPQVARPTDAFLVRVIADKVDMPDVFSWQPDDTHARRHSAKLPLQGVAQ